MIFIQDTDSTASYRPIDVKEYFLYTVFLFFLNKVCVGYGPEEFTRLVNWSMLY